MTQDWLADVRRYSPNADPDAVAGIVRHCGIALRNRDSSLVSFSDPGELGRVRDRFLRKKLALEHPDNELDEAIADVGEAMKADHTKNRVTVYYLLADRFGKLPMFVKARAVAAEASSESTSSADAGEVPQANLVQAAASPARHDEPARESFAATAPQRPAPAGFGHAPAHSTVGREERRLSALGEEESARMDASKGSSSGWWMWALLVLAAILLLYFLFRT